MAKVLNLYTFLEEEYNRVNKLNSFFNEKYLTYLENSQTKTLIAKQEEINGDYLDGLLEFMHDENSNIHSTLADIYNSAFGSIKRI